MGKGNVRFRICVRLALATWGVLVSGGMAGDAVAQAAEEGRGDHSAAGKDFAVRDDFDGKLALSWEPIRPDPSHVSLDKHAGKLTITTQRGTIHGNEKADVLSLGTQAKNLYMIANPALEGADFVATTRIESFAPSTNWQQAGLMVYDDDDNYLKCDLEWSPGAPSGMVCVYLRETDQESDFFSARPEKKCSTFWLRVTKRGALYEYAYSDDGEVYALVGEKSWGNGTPKSIGIFAKNGGNPLAGGVDARFDFFEVRSLTDDEKNQPAYVQRQKLQGAWKVVSFEMSGKAVEDLALAKFTFDHGQLVVEERDKTVNAEYTVDVSKEPKQLVLLGLFSQQGRPVAAAYSLEGDTLTLCLDPRAGAAAPAEVATEQGDGRLMITLDRAEKSD